MSYDLTFWRQEGDLGRAPKDIYLQLLEGKEVRGLVALDIQAVLAAAQQRFPGMTEVDGEPPWLLWESDDAQAVMELYWSDHHVHAVCRNVTQDDVNALIDICGDAGCALYDPQVDERFSQPDGPPAPPTLSSPTAGGLRFWRRKRSG